MKNQSAANIVSFILKNMMYVRLHSTTNDPKFGPVRLTSGEPQLVSPTPTSTAATEAAATESATATETAATTAEITERPTAPFG